MILHSPATRILSLLGAMIFAAALHAHARLVDVASYTSLRDACQSALPGDTIIVAPGIYTITNASRIMISARPGPVLVRGASGDPRDVVVQGAGQDDESVQMIFNLADSPRWTFQDLTTRNSYYHGFKFDRGSTDCVLRDVIMRDHGESGVKGTSDPAAGVYPDRLLVERCDIGFTAETGGTRPVVEGIDGVGVDGWVIRGSRFVNVQKGGAPAYAIFTKGNSSNTVIDGNRFENCFIGASFGGGGTAPQYFRDNDRTYEHRNGIIRNNVIIRCSDAGIYINKGTNCRIYNNTLFECELTIQLRFAETSGDVRNNLVFRSSSNGSEPVVRVRDSATLSMNRANRAALSDDFVEPFGSYARLNLHPRPTPSVVNAGEDLSADVPTDYDGRPRPALGAFDIGAYEYYPPLSVRMSDPSEKPREPILYPNPFAGDGTARITMMRGGRLRVTVIDLLGAELGTIVDGYREKGGCDVTIPSVLPNGVVLERGSYLLLVDAAGSRSAVRFVVGAR